MSTLCRPHLLRAERVGGRLTGQGHRLTSLPSRPLGPSFHGLLREVCFCFPHNAPRYRHKQQTSLPQPGPGSGSQSRRSRGRGQVTSVSWPLLGASVGIWPGQVIRPVQGRYLFAPVERPLAVELCQVLHRCVATLIVTTRWQIQGSWERRRWFAAQRFQCGEVGGSGPQVAAQ